MGWCASGQVFTYRSYLGGGRIYQREFHMAEVGTNVLVIGSFRSTRFMFHIYVTIFQPFFYAAPIARVLILFPARMIYIKFTFRVPVTFHKDYQYIRF